MSALIAGYARTPFTRFNGALAAVPATLLGAHAAAAALGRSGILPQAVQRVYAGQVLQAGAGQNPARQAAIGAGISPHVPALTLNAVCLSGVEAIIAGEQLISGRGADVVVAIGQESMSLAPHVYKARTGTKYGAIEMLDTLEIDGLTDAFDGQSMGAATEKANTSRGITRAKQDSWATRSHQLAAAAEAFRAGEISPYTHQTRVGERTVSDDDGIRPAATIEVLSTLPPAFSSTGTITAGNSSQISDGAAAMVLVSSEVTEKLDITPIAEIVSHATVAGPDFSLHEQPAHAIDTALLKTEISLPDLAVLEINEAFAAVSIRSTEALGADPATVNQKGGAISLGHPIGASGVRIVGTLARQLAELGTGNIGAAGICGGGGQGSAVILRAL